MRKKQAFWEVSSTLHSDRWVHQFLYHMHHPLVLPIFPSALMGRYCSWKFAVSFSFTGRFFPSSVLCDTLRLGYLWQWRSSGIRAASLRSCACREDRGLTQGTASPPDMDEYNSYQLLHDVVDLSNQSLDSGAVKQIESALLKKPAGVQSYVVGLCE